MYDKTEWIIDWHPLHQSMPKSIFDSAGLAPSCFGLELYTAHLETRVFTLWRCRLTSAEKWQVKQDTTANGKKNMSK